MFFACPVGIAKAPFLRCAVKDTAPRKFFQTASKQLDREKKGDKEFSLQSLVASFWGLALCLLYELLYDCNTDEERRHGNHDRHCHRGNRIERISDRGRSIDDQLNAVFAPVARSIAVSVIFYTSLYQYLIFLSIDHTNNMNAIAITSHMIRLMSWCMYISPCVASSIPTLIVSSCVPILSRCDV